MEKVATKKELIPNYIRDMNEFKNKAFEEQYAISLANIIENGTISEDRTGVGTKRIQSQQITINLQKEFPILLGKKMNFKNALIEMMWILSGKNDLKFLKDNGVNYWDSWVKEDGTFGPIYGKQMRNFGERKYYDNLIKPELITLPGVDQLTETIFELIKNPDSRRLVVSLWNPVDNPKMSLTCCHHDYQLSSFVNNNGIRQLDLHIKQRSADSFVGIPYDFILFAIYLLFISEITGISFGKIHTTNADYHMYLNHDKQVKLYLERYFEDIDNKIHDEKIDKPFIYNKFDCKPNDYLQSLGLLSKENVTKTIEYFINEIIKSNFNYWEIKNYDSYPFIKVDVAV